MMSRLRVKIYLLASLFAFFLVLLGLVFANTGFAITGDVVSEERAFDYSWTTAICDGNECRDYEVVCSDGEAIKFDAVSEVVHFPSDWKDTREKKSNFCE